MKKILLLLTVITLLSCEQETTNYKDPIRGTWTTGDITLVINNTITVIESDSVYTENYEYYEYFDINLKNSYFCKLTIGDNLTVFKIIDKGEDYFMAYSLPDTINLLSFTLK